MGKPVGPVVLAMEVNDKVIRDYPFDMCLYQEWGRHDRFKMTFVIPRGHANRTSLVAFKENAPVKFTWGRAPDNILIWYGYVNHHILSSNSTYEDSATSITYTFLGTSKVMNADQWKRWENTTPSAMAQAIARKYSFRAVTTFIDWRIKYEVQAGESDFEFLNRMAQKYGYRFWVSGGTLYFIDPAVILHGSSGKFVPQYYIDHYPGRIDTARDFNLVRGDAIPGGNQAVRKISGVDASNNRPFQISADQDSQAKNIIHQTQRHVTSKGEAKRLMNAQASLSQFWQAGSVNVFGYVLLYPNKMILLDGQGLPNGAGGNWIVNGVKHELKPNLTYDSTKDIYTTRLRVVKNTTDFIPKVKSYQTVNPEIVQCVLAGGVWQSINTSAITTGVVEPG